MGKRVINGVGEGKRVAKRGGEYVHNKRDVKGKKKGRVLLSVAWVGERGVVVKRDK